MLYIRSLDDQRYEDIVEQARGRLPSLCPPWTDHNAHDPGITILELMAWYKELQQYHMDQISPAMRWKLLRLAGIEREREQPAVCAVEPGPWEPSHLALTRLEGPQGIPFELLDPVPAHRLEWRSAFARREDGTELDLTPLITGGMRFQPFRFGGMGRSALCLGFSGIAEHSGRGESQRLHLWFEVEQPEGPPRNPPEGDSPPPRVLTWDFDGCGEVQPLTDETWSLSWSGYVTLPVPRTWRPGPNGLYWVTIRETDPGCEETVRLAGLSASRYRCVQQESRARSEFRRIEGTPGQRILVRSAQAMDAEPIIWRRLREGWTRLERFRDWKTPEGRRFELDGTGTAQDGEDNLLLTFLRPECRNRLVFHAAGVPEETFFLDLNGQRVLTEQFTLLCRTLDEDGAVRPAVWKPTDDLSSHGPRDRVFFYDPDRETITFGDGRHGAIPLPGPESVMALNLTVSRCGEGNLPAEAGLCFYGSGAAVSNTAASGGRNPETPEEARRRLSRKLAETVKCVSAADYEACVRRTPGLRVGGAKAIPGYDGRPGTGAVQPARVSVAVLPASERERPMPDKRFLTLAGRQLERYRPVCIRVRAIPPRYVPLELSALLAVMPGTRKEAVYEALSEWFRPRAERIGETVRKDDVSALLQKVSGVLHVRQVELRGLDQNSYRTGTGDFQLPPDGLPALERMQVELVKL